MLYSARVGGRALPLWQREWEWGDVLAQRGVRAIPFGIGVMLLGFVLKSAGTQAGPTDTALPVPRVSVFGTIHPEIFRLGAPLASSSAGDRVRLASLEPQVGLFDVPTKPLDMLADADASPCRSSPFDERFAALGEPPASFDKRFASSGDCPASFDDSLAAAMQVLADSLRLPPDRTVQAKRRDAPTKSIVAKADVGPAPTRKEVPPLEDDGRTAIYDITARIVYLPGGR